MSARLRNLPGQPAPAHLRDDLYAQHINALFRVTGPANVLTRLAYTIYTAANVHNAATDPHLREHVIDPLLDAFLELLNYDRGGLDGGMCSAWAESVREWLDAQQ